MNNDLISRKTLISRIESEYRKWGEDYDAGQILCDIEDLPTAYDVDMVIERLKIEIEGCNDAATVNRAVEIIKAGE